MTEAEGRLIASLAKRGEPASEWSQDRPNTYTNIFGVVDPEGKTIPGLQVEFAVFISPYLGHTRFVFTLRKAEFGRPERAYQQEVNLRPGVKPSDHSASHEHYGDPRFPADADWAHASFEEAVKRFCAICHLTLDEPLPDYRGFVLK